MTLLSAGSDVEQFFALNFQGLVQTIALIGTMFLVFGSMRERLNILDKKVDKLEGVMVQMARQDERLSAMDQRLLAQGRRIDRMQYGSWTSQEENQNYPSE